jgi:pyruvate formate lyase activating enzyme
MCEKCIEVCQTGALSKSVKSLTLDEYLELVERQKRIVGDNGGITFSGGEPLAQGKTLIEFLDKTNTHKAIETCGYADEELFKEVIKRVDYVMFDVKIADSTLHKKYTGVSNELILKNLEHLRNSGKDFILRTPLIKGITDTNDNLEKISEIVGSDNWEKLEFNPLTPVKYQLIGEDYLLKNN